MQSQSHADFRVNKKKDGNTSQLRKPLYAVNLSIRKRLWNDLISCSSRTDPPGTYNHVFSANTTQGLNSILTPRGA